MHIDPPYCLKCHTLQRLGAFPVCVSLLFSFLVGGGRVRRRGGRKGAVYNNLQRKNRKNFPLFKIRVTRAL